MAFADVNGQHLYFEDHGGDGPAVVFSHGFLMDHEMFAPQVDALAGRLRIITVDARGHGQTSGAGAFDYWDLAKDVLALMDHLDIAAATLVGMSQGGFVSMRASLLAPDRVRALVLIDSQAGLENEASVPAYEAMHEGMACQRTGGRTGSGGRHHLGPGARSHDLVHQVGRDAP